MKSRYAPPQSLANARERSSHEGLWPDDRVPQNKGVLWDGEVIVGFGRYVDVSALYAIVHDPSGKRYIGITGSLGSRMVGHFGTLRKGTHSCPRLQALWDETSPADWYPVLLGMGPGQQLDAERRAILLAGDSCINEFTLGSGPITRHTHRYPGDSREFKVSRIRAGLTVAEVAAAADLPVEVIGQWEAGVRRMPGWLGEAAWSGLRMLNGSKSAAQA